ncbi:MAG: DEAD/DEAH box helicase [Aeromicrobium sp.]|uniref:DEAD/DEAH box helicase n=1 Tax=Aeromicrobium sp. TaxID=1871063 RepID=UPI0026141B63|nr:DEAD/DEAH box helicase [Aeromicrobium sp.]MDF1704451.1 DEAD/DEAH box helicase [Aeromicrobium sp.]
MSTTPSTFADLGLSPGLVAVLSDLGYETPTPIQARAIPELLQGRDVVGLAQTGTGKTAAFALPMLDALDPDRSETQALIMAPTRELALQVADAVTSYAAQLPGIRVLPVYGGQGYAAQLRGLERGAHVVVGTPGRVIDHLERGSLELSGLEHLVLDEADEMLTMGFAEDVERILRDTPDDKQVALFSATMPPAIRRLAKKYLHDPIDVSIDASIRSTSTVTQRWIGVHHHGKFDALTRLLEVENGDGLLIFVRTKQSTEDLAERLRGRGFDAAALNGDLAQAQRERIVGGLKSGALDIVVATDVAARGLDVDRITHVINYDIPHDTEAYVHRIGRTGRAGRSGDAIVFVTPRERRMLSALEKVSGRTLEQMSVPSPDEVNERRASRLTESITSSLGSPQFHAFRALVEGYAAEQGVEMVDIAAALAVLSADDPNFFLRPEDEVRQPARSERRDRDDRGPREPRERGARSSQDRASQDSGDWTRYRLAVGKRHKIGPSAIVGALANEGGLKRSDFGKITIGADHAIVELTADLPAAVFDALATTRISGKLIDLRLDDGPPPRRERARVGDVDRGGRGGRPGKGPRKPRHTSRRD